MISIVLVRLARPLLGLGLVLAIASCEAPPPSATGSLRVTFYDGQLNAYARAAWADVGPLSYELRFSVEDAGGREVDDEVVTTTLYSWVTNLTFDCVPGEHHTVRARLLGAYEGRPLVPRGGRGGLALPQPYETTTGVLCSEQFANKAWLPDVTRPAIPELPAAADSAGSVRVPVRVALPTPLAGRDVTIAWEETVDYAGEGPFTYADLALGAAQGEDTRFDFGCRGYAGASLNVRLRPLLVLLDGEPLARDAWVLDDVVRETPCPESGDAEAPRADLTLTVMGRLQ